MSASRVTGRLRWPTTGVAPESNVARWRNRARWMLGCPCCGSQYEELTHASPLASPGSDSTISPARAW